MTTYTYSQEDRTVAVINGARRRVLQSPSGNGCTMRHSSEAAFAILNDWRGLRVALPSSLALATIMHEHCQMHATAPYEVTTDGLVMICNQEHAQA